MLSGNIEALPNGHHIFPWSHFNYARGRAPTIFEYLRKDLGWAEEKIWSIQGNAMNWYLDHSYHPLYGADYKASFVVEMRDDEIQEFVKTTVDTHHPDLFFINFGTTDHKGHTDIWPHYIAAIRHVDSVIWDLYNYIEADPYYTGKTTYILTADHGRESQAGWSRHGNQDWNCQHVLFLAWGPDTPSNVTVSTPRNHPDLAPTIMELLGGEAPLARSEIMHEMINGEQPELHYEYAPQLFPYGPQLARVWSSNALGDVDQVFIGQSRDDGTTWDQQRISFSSRGALLPTLAIDSDGVRVAWCDKRDTTWQLYRRFYSNSTSQWGPEERLSSFPLHILPDSPKILLRDDRELIPFLGQSKYIEVFAKTDTSPDWEQHEVYKLVYKASEIDSVLVGDSGVAAVFEGMNEDITGPEVWYYDIYFRLSVDNGATWLDPVRLTDTKEYPTQHPSIAAPGGDTIMVAFDEERDGVRQVYFMISHNLGGSWGAPVQLTHSTIGAWKPQVHHVKDLGTVVSYTDFDEGKGDIWYRVNDGSSWGDPIRITDTPDFSQNPSIVFDGAGNGFICWEEHVGFGQWQLKTRKFL